MCRSFGPPLQGGMGFWGGVSQGVTLGWVWGRPLAFGHGSRTQGGGSWQSVTTLGTAREAGSKRSGYSE